MNWDTIKGNWKQMSRTPSRHVCSKTSLSISLTMKGGRSGRLFAF